MPLNCNTPYIEAYILKEYSGLDEDLSGFIFGVKSLLNRPLLFHFQGVNGAVIYNMPISAFASRKEYEKLAEDKQSELSILETWDCQSNSIDTVTYSFLENKVVDVFCRDRQWRRGRYLFTIDDYVSDVNHVQVGYSRDVDSKCFHFIVLDCGRFGVYPNNVLRWHNPDHIVPYPKDTPPKIRVFSEELFSEHIDRTNGNSPYLFYEHIEKAPED